ncbi:DCN1-like protein 3 [Ptychodera flava]|uniref:DCN1-like protein 3 n=1 Tax=Ptychodera flava TaxID=63121 RepID=UPI00396A2CEA
MGKCLSSCAEPSPSAEQNGGPKSTESQASYPAMTRVPAETAPPPPQPTQTYTQQRTYPHTQTQTHTQTQHSMSSVHSIGTEYYSNGSQKKLSGDRIKMSTNQRKTSNGIDSGRRSLVAKSEFTESKIHKLFDHYKDENEDCILAEGMEVFCQDLKVDPAAFIMLVLAWKFQAMTMCQFTRKEFLEGCKALKADSIRGIQAKFPDLLEEVQNDAKFKDLYRFTFQFGLDLEGGQRSLPCDIAIPLWKLVFSNREPAILERWVQFLSHGQIRGISKDTWNMFLNFTEVVGADFTGYDDNEAWPSLFDDFVEYETEKKKARLSGNEERTDGRNLPVYYY